MAFNWKILLASNNGNYSKSTKSRKTEALFCNNYISMPVFSSRSTSPSLTTRRMPAEIGLLIDKFMMLAINIRSCRPIAAFIMMWGSNALRSLQRRMSDASEGRPRSARKAWTAISQVILKAYRGHNGKKRAGQKNISSSNHQVFCQKNSVSIFS
jgi:hypothetical protein